MANQRSQSSLKKFIFFQAILVLSNMQTTSLLVTNIQNPSINTLALDDLKLNPVKLTQASLISSTKITNVSVDNTAQPIETINVQNQQLKSIRLNASSSSSNTRATKTIQMNESENAQVSYGQPYGKLSLQELAHAFVYSVQLSTSKSVSNASETMNKASNKGNIMMNNSQASAFNNIMTKNALKLTKDLLDSAESQTLSTQSSNKNTSNKVVAQPPQSNLIRLVQTNLANNTTLDSNIPSTHLL